MKTQFISALSMLCVGALMIAAAPARADTGAAPPDNADVAPAQGPAAQNDAVDSAATPPTTTQTKPGKPAKPGRIGNFRQPPVKLAPGLAKFFGRPGCIKFPKRFRAGIRIAQKEASRLKDLLKTAQLPAAVQVQVNRLLGAVGKLPKGPQHVLQGTLSSCGRHSGTDD